MATLRPILFALLLTSGCGRSTPAPAPGSAPEQSRFVFMPALDDGGMSSGAHALTICLPAGYAATDRRYPVIYCLDGESAFFTRGNGVGSAIGYELAHDQLVHDGLIQPAIFVAIHNGTDAAGAPVPGNRGIDYYPNSPTRAQGSKADGFFSFVSTVVKPMIDGAYRTRPEPVATGVAGFSASGMGAFWMAYAHPEVFGMALCQAPALFPQILDPFLAEHAGAIPAVRLWLDVGSLEIQIGLLTATYDASRALVAKGFRQNEDLAFHIGYGHGHEKFDCNRRMRCALRFLLGSERPALTGAAIVEIDTGTHGPIRLDRMGRAALELRSEDGYHINDCTAAMSVADASVAALVGDVNELQPIGAGTTTISAVADGRTVTEVVTVPAPMASITCPAAAKPVTVDGDLSEWDGLPIVVDALADRDARSGWTGPSDLSYRLACTRDERFVYVAIATTDDRIASVAGVDPWFQDGVEVRLDSRPAADRLRALPVEFVDILLVAMCPVPAGGTRPPHQADKLPSGTLTACVATPTGHATEIAIPSAYLDAKAGRPWSDLRLNVVVNDLDDDPSGFRGDKLWWQPDWRTPQNAWGSGTFTR